MAFSASATSATSLSPGPPVHCSTSWVPVLLTTLMFGSPPANANASPACALAMLTVIVRICVAASWFRMTRSLSTIPTGLPDTGLKAVLKPPPVAPLLLSWSRSIWREEPK